MHRFPKLKALQITSILSIIHAFNAPILLADTDGYGLPPSPSLLVGNTIVRPESIETVARGIVARITNADLNGSTLSFKGDAIEQIIPLKAQNQTLREILNILGIQDQVSLSTSPIEVRFSLPQSRLKIQVANVQANTFDVRAGWELRDLKIDVKSLGIHVPKGAFDQAFDIQSKPITAGLKSGSAPIRFEIHFTTDLTEAGTKIHLKSVHTNLVGKSQPDFFASLGPLTVNKQPFELDIISNGNTLHADEPSLRKQFQLIEPDLIASMRTKVAGIIEENIKVAARKIEKEPPFKYDFNTTELLRDAPIAANLKQLLSNIKGDVLFSYLQYVKDTNQFSAQIATHLCLDDQCLVQFNRQSPIGVNDIKGMHTDDDVGVVLYESFIRDLVHSESFQKRIRDFYYSGGPSYGVDLSKKGVRLSFLPTSNSVAVVMNLEVDIKKTIKQGTSFGQSLQLILGDWIEQYFGTGNLVKVPLEIKFDLLGISKDNQGKPYIMINTRLPFDSSGNYLAPTTCSASECPSNLANMTRIVKGGFISALRKELSNLLPGSVNLPIGQTLQVQDFEFSPSHIRITPNHGLFISAELKDSTGRKTQ
jgi:hypothetical protein